MVVISESRSMSARKSLRGISTTGSPCSFFFSREVLDIRPLRRLVSGVKIDTAREADFRMASIAAAVVFDMICGEKKNRHTW